MRIPLNKALIATSTKTTRIKDGKKKKQSNNGKHSQEGNDHEHGRRTKRDYCKTILLLYPTNVKCENNGLFSSKARKETAAVDYALADPEDMQLVQHFFWGQIYDLELVESTSKAEKAKLDQIYDRILHQMGKARLKEPITTK